MSDNVNTTQATEVETEVATVSIENLQEQITELQSQIASQAEMIKTLETEKEEAAKKVKDEEEKQKEEAAKKASEDEEKDAENKKLKAELDSALQTIAEYKKQEEETMKKNKKMQRKASLSSFGFDEVSAEAAVEKFENLSDEAFEAMTSLLASKTEKPSKEEEETDSKDDKKMASVASVDSSVLDTVEVEPTVNLSIGNDEVSTFNSTRAELVEFVCARLGKKLNKGE